MFLLKVIGSYYLETCTEATDYTPAELSGECLQLFGHDVAFDVYCSFLDYMFCSNEGMRVHGCIAHLTYHDQWIATTLMCLKKRKSRGGNR